MKMMGETIELHNLSIGYQTKHGVRTVATGINGTIKSGELTCLLGANGVGKSTLLRTLSSFQPQTGGEILLEGSELSEYSDKQLSRLIGVVLTEKPDVRNMTVVWADRPIQGSGELIRKKICRLLTKPSRWWVLRH